MFKKLNSFYGNKSRAEEWMNKPQMDETIQW
jgi:hypothetical protein